MPKTPRFALIAGLLLACVVVDAAQPDESLAIGERQARDFLVRARAADAIADPLARCLAFPDFPGSQWPAGLAVAQCQLEFGPRLGAADLHEALDAGDLAPIEARYAADLERHFSETDFSEAIHADFDYFDGSTDSDVLSQAWLAKSPGSAFALAARAEHYRRALDALRAGRYAAQITPAESAAMEHLAAQSIDYFHRALAVEPRLMEAFVGLVQVSRLASHSLDEETALAQGRLVDPACVRLNIQAMTSLTPLWGGGYAQMSAFAAQLEPLRARRPLLALVTDWPAAAAAEQAWKDNRYEDAARLAAPVTKSGSVAGAFFAMAVALRHDEHAGPYAAAAYAVAETRFGSNPDTALTRGILLQEQVKDPAWALPALFRAVMNAPQDGRTHFALANDYVALSRPDDAQREFLLAMADEETATSAMRNLSVLYTARAPKEIDPATWIAPADAIRMASEVAPAGKVGAFAFPVVASGSKDGWVYLNSTHDYRDSHNLTIAITPNALTVLAMQLGGDVQAALRGKTVLVTGVVRRVPIYAVEPTPSEPRSPIYYQTHIEVSYPPQLRVVESK